MRSYARPVPKLWSTTVAEHRTAVREAVLDAIGAIVADRGFPAVTMKGVAEASGVGRATLYRYFDDVHAVVGAWHEREVNRHLVQVVAARDAADGAVARIEAMLEALARLSAHDHGAVDVVSGRLDNLEQAWLHLREVVADTLQQGVASGEIRDDIPVHELASFCIRALGGLASATPVVAVRFVDVVMGGLRQPS